LNKDVLGFDVSVDNAQRMNVVDCFKDAVHDLGSLLVRERDVISLSLFHELPQRAHTNILHLNKDDLFILEKLIDFHDVGMVKGQQ
jgi:hypothetical protein